MAKGALYGWYGDDFTGATDTLATLAESGRRALLFLRVPNEAELAAAGPLDAIGIAGATRAMAPDVRQAIDVLFSRAAARGLLAHGFEVSWAP